MAKNIVLVHGGFVDGAGWEGVYKILKRDVMEIASYNEHRSAPFLRALVDYRRQVYSVEGADDVI